MTTDEDRYIIACARWRAALRATRAGRALPEQELLARAELRVAARLYLLGERASRYQAHLAQGAR